MAIKITYRGEDTNYPLYENEEKARAALIAEGVDEGAFEETWPSPRGVEKLIQFVEVEDAN